MTCVVFNLQTDKKRNRKITRIFGRGQFKFDDSFGRGKFEIFRADSFSHGKFEF